MKKAAALLLALIVILNLCPAFSEEAAQAPECEWNVLFYLCGSDLESKGSAATINLREIASATPNDKVNILIETGGCRQWHTKDALGFEVANDRLQRWRYCADGFTLVEEVEDACMANGQTLTDFIQWAGANYPARKNLLLLWDHGSGSCKGLIADENYDFAIMPIYVLEKALRDGGTHFDLILTDTCLMASLEMVQAVAPYADYLAASEETLAGEGTCYGKWVPYLYERPDCSALQLAKRICDLTQQAYTEKDNQNAIGTFTMSVIDLSKTEPLTEAFNAFIHAVALLTQDPDALYNYAWSTHYAENYAYHYMCDLFDLSRRAVDGGLSPKTAHALQDAIEDAVVYNLRSNSHIYSHGLSFFNYMNADGNTLDHFARTCKNAEHLAYLDCCNPKWDAPEWVYEQTEKLPELNRSDYLLKPVVTYSEDDGRPWLTLETGNMAAAFLSYELMRVDSDSGIMYALGACGDVIGDTDEATGITRFAADFDGTWPTLDGMPQYVSIADDREEYVLYNIPVFFAGRTMQMRVKRDYPAAGEAGNVVSAPFEIQGIWNEMDSHTGLPGRDVYPIDTLEGMTVGLYRVTYSRDLMKVADHIQERDYTLAPETEVAIESLPEGDYMLRFVLEDVFGNIQYSDGFIPAHWDGKQVTYPQD